ncbi:hypothetical protein NQU17_11740 [Clostridiaceae bacterium HFYG-1003]|nr:hypothetical protein NQU17_11740 [Clostridiaceae bacterium HFYG-1003]
MEAQKQTRLKILNSLSWLILAAVSLSAYFLPIQATVLTLETRYPAPVVGPSYTWYLYFITLAGLTLFTLFQAGASPHRELIRQKARHALGWTVGASFILYSLAILSWHYELLGLAIFLLILTTLLLFAINGSIREDEDLWDETLLLRAPFCLFLGWVLFLLFQTIAMRWHTLFQQDVSAFLLLAVFLFFVIYYGLTTRSPAIVLLWLAALLLKFLQMPGSLLRWMILGCLAALVLALIAILGKGPRYLPRHKLVSKGMDKYNFGRPSQLEALEEELNAELKTKPGDRIRLK